MGMPRLELVFAGLGGHGILFMGRVLGYAAILAGKDAVMTTSYSPAQRGGWSKAYIVLDDKPIEYPVVTKADLLVATTIEMLKSEIHMLRKNGVLILDSDIIKKPVVEKDKYRVVMVPARTIAREASGEERTANMALVGAVVALTKTVEPVYIEKAIETIVTRKHLIEPNLKTFRYSYQKYSSQERPTL